MKALYVVCAHAVYTDKYLRKSSVATRLSNDVPTQGSAFHEIVVLPTLSPHLARPYHLPGTPGYVAAQAVLQAEANSARATEGGDGAADTPDTEVVSLDSMNKLQRNDCITVTNLLRVSKTVPSLSTPPLYPTQLFHRL